jgi:hypothetical protein
LQLCCRVFRALRIGRHSFHDDVLWQPDGGEELQHHGSCESCAGECGEIRVRRAWSKGHSRARDFLRDHLRHEPLPASPTLTSYLKKRRPKRRRAAWSASKTLAPQRRSWLMMRPGSSLATPFTSTADIMSSIDVLPFSTCFRLFQVAQMGGCLVSTFVNVRGHRSLLQCIAQFGSKKTTRRVAGNTGVETINQIANHR